MTSHINDKHTNACKICLFELSTNELLYKHEKEVHKYHCEFCGNTSVTQSEMEDHILNLHVSPDFAGFFQCEECKFISANKTSFVNHFKNKHGSKSITAISQVMMKLVGMETELLSKSERMNTISKELDLAKEKVERQKTEINAMKAEYEAKISIINQKYTSTLSENNTLNERNNLLFKLGQSYLERYENKSKSDKQENKGRIGELEGRQVRILVSDSSLPN